MKQIIEVVTLPLDSWLIMKTPIFTTWKSQRQEKLHYLVPRTFCQFFSPSPCWEDSSRSCEEHIESYEQWQPAPDTDFMLRQMKYDRKTTKLIYDGMYLIN